MAKWIGEWVMVSMLVVLGLGMLFMLWAVWPLLPERLPAEIALSLNLESIVAMGMLLVVLAGFGKLMVGH
jgi:hypothetical protein